MSSTDDTTETVNSATATDNSTETLKAISASQAIIEFELDGTIITANDNFLNALGYTLSEVKGKHHSMFAEPEFAKSPEYQQFWDQLRQGQFQAGEFRRLHKNGSDVWIQAAYNPVSGNNGRVYKVVKNAVDITARKVAALDNEAESKRLVEMLNGIGASQAMIEFELDGTILTANENFLGALGYTLDEVKGKHHSIFVEPELAKSSEYRQFWDELRQGQFQSGEFKRIHKSGDEIWIQASYNPVMGKDGHTYKVVKNAVDITAKKIEALKNESDAFRVMQMLDNMPINVMMCDAKNLEINYIETSA